MLNNYGEISSKRGVTMHCRGIKAIILSALLCCIFILPAGAEEQADVAEYKEESSINISYVNPTEAEQAAIAKAEAEQAAIAKAEAEQAAIAKAADRAEVVGNRIWVAVNSSQLLPFHGVERVAVANPEIADVMVISGSEIMVVGKSPGRTSMHVWSWNGRTSYVVEVATDDAPIANEIRRILGINDIKVAKVGKTIILEGRVTDKYQKLRAEKIASAYGEKVVNLLEITQALQVRIEAKVIEISKRKSTDLGIKWGNDPASGSFRFGQTPMTDWKVKYGDGSEANTWNNALSLGDYGHRKWGQSLGPLGGYWDINAELDALAKTGAAKILSKPYTVTLSGETANILVGGQIPVPVSNNNGSIVIEWKDFGIKLDIQPEVNSDGLINSKVKAEVSALDWANAVAVGTNMKIPSLTVRKAEAVVALKSGQTMAIGGMYASSEAKSVTKVPLLGKLPVIGALFTSKSFAKDETELIILVTPTIVDLDGDMLKQLTPELKKEVENSK
jgi:pilus assembly protein CpaC